MVGCQAAHFLQINILRSCLRQKLHSTELLYVSFQFDFNRFFFNQPDGREDRVTRFVAVDSCLI